MTNYAIFLHYSHKSQQLEDNNNNDDGWALLAAPLFTQGALQRMELHVWFGTFFTPDALLNAPLLFIQACLNNYWPIPLTTIISKYFERWLCNHIKLCVTAEVDFNTNCSQTVSLGRQTFSILTLTTEFPKAMCRDPSCMLWTDMTISASTTRIPLLSLQMIRQSLHSIWHNNMM